MIAFWVGAGSRICSGGVCRGCQRELRSSLHQLRSDRKASSFELEGYVLCPFQGKATQWRIGDELEESAVVYWMPESDRLEPRKHWAGVEDRTFQEEKNLQFRDFLNKELVDNNSIRSGIIEADEQIKEGSVKGPSHKQRYLHSNGRCPKDTETAKIGKLLQQIEKDVFQSSPFQRLLHQRTGTNRLSGSSEMASFPWVWCHHWPSRPNKKHSMPSFAFGSAPTRRLRPNGISVKWKDSKLTFWQTPRRNCWSSQRRKQWSFVCEFRQQHPQLRSCRRRANSVCQVHPCTERPLGHLGWILHRTCSTVGGTQSRINYLLHLRGLTRPQLTRDLFVLKIYLFRSSLYDVSFFSFSLQRLNAMALGSPVSPKEGDSTSNSEPVGGIHSAAYLFCICISVGCGFRDRQLLSRVSVALNRSFLYQPMCRTCPLGSLSPLPVPSPSWHCDGHAVCYRRWRWHWQVAGPFDNLRRQPHTENLRIWIDADRILNKRRNPSEVVYGTQRATPESWRNAVDWRLGYSMAGVSRRCRSFPL